MGRSRYTITEPDKPHFMTCTVVEWLPVFTRPDTVQIVLDCWRYQREHEAMMREKLDYIHANPVKRGYVRLPEHWRYSSASHYAGLDSLIDIDSW